jgi:hypothetical protein
MKARKVKGLDAGGPLASNAVRIAETRIGELRSFAGAARDPGAVEALHDMRIAAKRVRYVLELTEPCLGSAAARGAKRARQLQTLLGEIHDCDELLPLLDEHERRLRAEDAAAVRSAAGERAKDVDPALAGEVPNRRRYRGLEALRAFLSGRRQVLYARFVREWERLERDGFWDRVERELAQAADGTIRAAAGKQRTPARAH